MAHTEVVTELTAKDDQHKQVLSRAEKSIEGFGSKTRAALNSVGNLYTGLGVAAAVGFGTAMVKSQMESMDATAKLADRIGTTTEGLQGLRHAAELTGAGSSVLDAALSKLTVNLGLAVQGTGEAGNSLKALGLDAADLANKDPAAAFGDIAEALKKIPNAAQKMAIVTKIFGESGGGLLNLLASGKEGLAEMAAEAEELGLTFSRVDAAQVEAANDAIAKMRSSLSGLATQAAAELAPFITMFSGDLTEGIKEANASLNDTSEKVGIVGTLMGKVVDVIDFVVDGFKFAQWWAVRWYTGLAEGITGLLRIAAKLPSAMGGDWFQDLADSAQAFSDSMKQSADAKWDEAMKAFTDPTPSERAKALAEQMKNAASNAKDAAAAVSSIGTAADKSKESLDKTLEGWQEKIDHFGKTDRRAIIDKIIADGADDDAIGKLSDLDRKLTELEEHAKAMDLGKSLAESLRTPAEELQAKLDEYDKLLSEKAIDDQTAARARSKAKDDYDQATGLAALEEQTRTKEEKLAAALNKLETMRNEGLFEGREDLYDRAAKMYREQYGDKPEQQQARPASFEGLDSLYKRIAASAAGKPAEERTADAAEKTASGIEKVAGKLDEVKSAITNKSSDGVARFA